MSTEEFNALPLEARRFIETHAGCLSCGNQSAKLDKAFELYNITKMEKVYVLFGGGINFIVDKQKGVLYNIRQDDTPQEVRVKLELAKRIFEKSPEVFISYDTKAIAELAESLPAEEFIDLDEEPTEVEGESLSIDIKTATYDELKDFVKATGLAAKSQKKQDLIDAIEGDLN